MKKKKPRLHTCSKSHVLAHRIRIADQAVTTARAWRSTWLDDELRPGASQNAANADELAEHAGAVDIRRAGSHEVAVSTNLHQALGIAAPVAAHCVGSGLRPIMFRAANAPHTPVARPGLDQGAVAAEVLAGQQPSRLSHLDGRIEQPCDRLVLDEPVAVPAEHRVVPHCVVDGPAHESADQQIAIGLIDQLPFVAHAVQHLQQHRTHALLGCDARASTLDVGLIYRREARIHPRQGFFVDPEADFSRWVIGWHELLQPHGTKRTFNIAVCAAYRCRSRINVLPQCSLRSSALGGVFQQPVKM